MNILKLLILLHTQKCRCFFAKRINFTNIMWTFLTKLILRRRLLIVSVISIGTIFMAYKATQVQFSYTFTKMLPDNDETSIEYDKFKSTFGEDGSIFTIGINDKDFFEVNKINALNALCNEIKALNGIEEIVSVTRIPKLIKNDSLKKFDVTNIASFPLKNQNELDSFKTALFSNPLYENILYNNDNHVYLILITLNKKMLNDKKREALVMDIKKRFDQFSVSQKIEIHYSGLPYIRTITTQKIKSELYYFIALSLLLSAIIMILFFKSFRVVVSSLIIVFISIIWSIGTLSVFNYKISILTGVIPSLLIIIAIENCIYIINKYHWEYKLHQNKTKALSRVIHRIGKATLVTNLTTATGFATFIFISNKMLFEFGIVASLNIMFEYVLTLTLIPIILSFLKAPSEKQIAHIDAKRINLLIDTTTYLVLKKRKPIFIVASILVLGCLFGTTLLTSSGKMVDDLKSNDKILTDLKFFEKNYGGIMPFEIVVDTKVKNGVMRLSTIKKIEQLQNVIATYPEFSKSLSLADFAKTAKQAFFNGKKEYYSLPNENEKNFVFSYIKSTNSSMQGVFKSFVDSTKQMTRISVQIRDIGMTEMARIKSQMRTQIDSIFPSQKYNVSITGNSIVFAEGTHFLINNLIESVFIGIILISIIIAVVFHSARMVIIAIICNLIPLLFTAAVMGYGQIPLKPSTLIVFSVSLGIAIDNAILFLSKLKTEMGLLGGDLIRSVRNAIEEVGISMIYSSIVLVIGFGIFIISDFGGTQALGMLISIALFLALFFNLLVLPSLILAIKKI